MAHTKPVRTAHWHAARAEELLRDAGAPQIDRWWHRWYRQELIARAQVHATLAAALPMETTVYAAADQAAPTAADASADWATPLSGVDR